MIAMLCVVGLLAAANPQAAQPQAPGQARTPPRDSTTDKKSTAVIKGTVTAAEGGRPLRRAQIRLSAPELTQARTTSTNPQGRYEFKDLPAGRYTISVSRNGHLQLQYGQRRPGEPPKPLQIAEGQTVEKLDFALPKAGIISGRLTDETGDAFSDVRVFAMQNQFYMGRRHPVLMAATNSDDAGQYRLTGLAPGEYIVMAQVRETWTTDGQPPQVYSYAPTYSGGTANPADALRIRVGIGQDVSAVDLALLAVPAATLAGTAIGSDGLPLAGGNVSVSSEIMGPGGGTFSSVGGTTIGPDGSWRIKDLPPGEFTLSARSVARDKPTETATMRIVVTGDMEGIGLVADGGATLTGKVVTDDGATLPEARSLRISARTTVPGRRDMPQLAGDDNGIVKSDGSFVLKGVSGPSLIQVQAVPRGWAVKSIEIGEKNYVDAPIDLRTGRDLEGVKVTLTNHFPALTGQITDEKGLPAEGTVLLFPSDAEKWLESAGGLRTSRPDQSGMFRLDTVRPGDYLAIALDYVQQWQANDPEFLESLRDKATKVKLEEGANQHVALQITK